MSHKDEVGQFAVEEPDVARALSSFLLGHVIDGAEVLNTKYFAETGTLLKTMLVCGSLGTGKTSTCIHLLSRLWRKYKIPFLLFDSHATNCRLPVLLADPFSTTINVFTLGNKSVSPLQINAFEVPAGVDSQSHLDGLMLIFQASFKMNLPESDFLRQALILMYQQGRRPTIDDLERCTTTQSFGFAGERLAETRQKIASILVQLRLGAKADLFVAKNAVSLKTLFSKPAVIELREAFSEAEKNFCLNVLLFCVYQSSRKLPAGQPLRQVLVLDDAETMMNTGAPFLNVNKKSDAASASSLSVSLLAQLRVYGYGLVIATNNPAALPETIVDNCNLRVIFRLLGNADYRAISGGTFFNEHHRRVIASQLSGHAVVYKAGDAVPYHLRTVFDPSLQIEIPETSEESDDIVRKVMSSIKA